MGICLINKICDIQSLKHIYYEFRYGQSLLVKYSISNTINFQKDQEQNLILQERKRKLQKESKFPSYIPHLFEPKQKWSNSAIKTFLPVS